MARKRVSYVIPPPTVPVPRLKLPPHGMPRSGKPAPLLMQDGGVGDEDDSQLDHRLLHPAHRLGVAALALDTSTILEGRDTPEGILYTGGRDGLIMSWDLGLPMKKRMVEGAKFVRSRWEVMTGWADEFEDDDMEPGHYRPTSDGDVIGDVPLSATVRRRHLLKELDTIPYERQWETDLLSFKPGTPSVFRQCAQAHEDWVNDIVLCNHNQTVVSGSSDGTVKAWNPHALSSSEPTVIGLHGDYVRCITYSQKQRWIASGSFDRSVKLWDLSGSSKTRPLATLVLPDATAPKSSIYALATDPFGLTIASGSPERVIRLWDPRTGKRTGKLVGHTDNIRAILISDDSRYLLTGSADASIKLWSLVSLRCLHTFTHHTDSVWSLYSNHPSLEVFYSSDKSRLVCKVDVEGCADVSEGECILLCNESGETASAGINKIVSMDDNLLWTASGVSAINRWRVPQRRSVRAAASTSLYAHDGGSMSVESSPFLHQPLRASPTRLSHAFVGGPEFPPSPPSTRPSTAAGPGELPAHTSASLSTPLPRHVHHSVSFDTTDERDRGHDHENDQDHEHDQDHDLDARFGIPYDSLIRLTSPNDPFPYHLGRGGGVGKGVGGGGREGITSHVGRYDSDAEVATLYSAASFLSIPRALTRAGPPPALDANRGMFQHQHQPLQPHRSQNHQRPHVNSNIHPVQSQIQHQRHPHQYHYNHNDGHGYSPPTHSPPNSVHDPSHQLPTQYQSRVQPRSRTVSPIPCQHPDPDLHSQPHAHPNSHNQSHQSARHPHPYAQTQTQTQTHSYSHSSPNANTQYHPVSHIASSSEQTPVSAPATLPPPVQNSSSTSTFTPPAPAPPSLSAIAIRPVGSPPPPLHPPHTLSPRANYELRELASEAIPFSRVADYVIRGDVGIIRALPLNDRIHVLTVDTAGEVAVWDIVKGSCLGRYAGVDVAAASMVGSDCGAEEGGGGSGNGEANPSADASSPNDNATTGTGIVMIGDRSPREALEVVRERIEGQAVIPKWASVDTKGGVLVVHLNERCFEVEVYGDDVGYTHDKGFTEEFKLNLGRWVLRNLFIGFIKEQQRLRKELQGSQHTPSPTDSIGKTHEGILLSRTNVNVSPTRTHHSSRHSKSSSLEVLKKSSKGSSAHPTFCSTVVVSSPDMLLALPPSISSTLDSHPVPLSTPLILIQTKDLTISRPGVPNNSRHPSPSASPTKTRNRAGTVDGTTINGSHAHSGKSRSVTTAAPGTIEPSTITSAEYFASLTRRSHHHHHHQSTTPQKTVGDSANGASTTTTPITPSSEFAGWSGPPTAKVHLPSETSRPITPTGLMGRLRNFGGKIHHRRPLSEAGHSTATPGSEVGSGVASSTTTAATTPTTATTNDDRKTLTETASKDPDKAMIQQILSSALSPPSSSDAPTLAFPSQTLLLISEEGSPNSRTIYRGTVGSTHYDLRLLEEVMPAWLLAYLLQNKMPTAPPVSKVSFVLLPWVSKDLEVETLPELLNTAQSKLTASRYLRVRKLVIHVQEKLDRINAPTRMSPAPTSPTSTVSDEKQDSAGKHKPRAEDLYEILCNDMLLPLEMTLAAVRQYVWKSSTELTMHYRLKLGKGRSHTS